MHSPTLEWTTDLCELVFIRHGEGEHMVDLPGSLGMKHPRLTELGRLQVRSLRSIVQVTDHDLVLASPTPRTIETARLLCGDAHPRRYASPLVGPRMFPQNVRFNPLPCDDLLEPQALTREFPEYELLPGDTASELWLGINTMPSVRFTQAATDLLRWCRQGGGPRVVVVSHDGTIHNYRELLGEKNLTRTSFLGPGEFHRVQVTT
jgi:broad specificity phosphatase PhoE